MRLQNKVAIVVGAGQTPGDTIGNGRATAILFAREGARVALVDCDYDSALETKRLIEAEDGQCFAVKADVTSEADCQAFVRATRLCTNTLSCTKSHQSAQKLILPVFTLRGFNNEVQQVIS